MACRGTGGLVPISSAQLYSVACALYFLFYSKKTSDKYLPDLEGEGLNSSENFEIRNAELVLSCV